MKAKGATVKTHTWSICFKIEQPPYTHNYYEGVIAQTAEEALEKVRKFYPDAIITSINHRGAVHHE